MFGAATKSAARRRKEDAANKPGLRKLVWVARREAPRISERRCGHTTNNGCATWRAIPLVFEGRQWEDGPTRGPRQTIRVVTHGCLRCESVIWLAGTSPAMRLC
jgi:hypothetical protein